MLFLYVLLEAVKFEMNIFCNLFSGAVTGEQ